MNWDIDWTRDDKVVHKTTNKLIDLLTWFTFELIFQPLGIRIIWISSICALKNHLSSLLGDAERKQQQFVIRNSGSYSYAFNYFVLLAQISGLQTNISTAHLPNAPYVFTILRGSNDVFMICLDETRFWTMGILRYAMRQPKQRLNTRRTLWPENREHNRSGKNMQFYLDILAKNYAI